MTRIAVLIVSFVLVAGCVAAQEAPEGNRTETLAEQALPFSLNPDSPGLQRLASTIGDARIVLLGEPWHGDGGAIRLKAELVEWLHREMGFDLLVMEADFYAVTRGWQALESNDEVIPYAAESFYPFWSTAAAVQPLWEYVASQFESPRPLRVAGVDVRHPASLSAKELPARIDSALVNVPEVDSERRRRFRRYLEEFLAAENPERPVADVRREFHAVLDALDRHMTFADSVDALLHREIRNLRSEARFAWEGASRDAAMGDNFRWVAGELYPDSKIIVWAHNNHLIEDKWMYFAAPDPEIRGRMEGRSPARIGGSTYLGDEIRQFAGPDVVAIATLTATGEYSPEIHRDAINAASAGTATNRAERTAPEGTLEAALAARGFDVAFLPLNDLGPGEDVAITQALDYTASPPRLMEWNRGYDGFLFVRETFPVTEGHPVALSDSTTQP